MSQATRSVPGMARNAQFDRRSRESQWSLVTREQLLEAGSARPRIAALLRSGRASTRSSRVYATCGSVRGWHQAVDGNGARHRRRRGCFALVGSSAVEVRAPARGRVRGPVRGRCSSLGEARGSPHARSFLTTTWRCVRDSRARASSGRFATARPSSRRSSSVVSSMTGFGAVTCRSFGCMRCAARLDSGPGRRLAVIKDLLGQRDASFNPGGSASELHVLDVIRDAGLPEPVQQYPVRAGRPIVRPRLRVARAAGLRRVLRPRLAFRSERGRIRQRTAARHWSASDWRPLVFTDTSSDAQIVRDVSERAARPTPSDGEIEHRRSA